MKLLALTIEGFQEIEMYGFLGTLNRSGRVNNITYWNPDNKLEVQGINKIGSIKCISDDLNVDDFDAIFIPGGFACRNLRKNDRAINLIKEFIQKDKWIFAICDGPNALFERGLLTDKVYSSYPIDNIKNNSGVKRTKEYVSVDGKYITGKCPSSSIDLALKVIEVLFTKVLSECVYEDIYAIEE